MLFDHFHIKAVLKSILLTLSPLRAGQAHLGKALGWVRRGLLVGVGARQGGQLGHARVILTKIVASSTYFHGHYSTLMLHVGNVLDEAPGSLLV